MADNPGAFQYYPGHAKIDHVKIIKENSAMDVTSTFIEFNVDASIMDTSATLSLTLLDAKNILGNLSIESGDSISIQITHHKSTHEYIGRIVNIEGITNHDRQRSYNINAISNFAFVSLYQKISRSYSGTTASIANSIYEEFSGGGDIGVWDPSLGNQQLVIPNWSPIKTLNWLAGRSRAQNDSVRFRFFQDAHQRQYFMPIERANELWQEPSATFRYNNVTSMLEGDIPNTQAVAESISELNYSDAYDIRNMLTNGKMSGTLYRTDLTSKNLSIVTHNYFDEFNPGNYLNDHPQWRRNDYGPGKVVHDHYASRNNAIQGLNKISDVSSIKKTNLDMSQTINIVVTGNDRVDVGQVVNIEIPSPEPVTDQMRDQRDLKWSGRYYVVAIRNMFTRDGQQTALTLTKESSIQALE